MERHFILVYKDEHQNYKSRCLTDFGISKESEPKGVDIDVDLPEGLDEATFYYAIYQEASELELTDQEVDCIGYVCSTGTEIPAWKFLSPNGAVDLKNLFSIMINKIGQLENKTNSMN